MLMRISHQSVTRCKWSRPSLQIWGFVLCSRGLPTLGLNSAGYLSGPTDFGIELCKVPVWGFRLWCFTVRVQINPWGSESSPKSSPREFKSSPGGPHRAPDIELQGSKSSPGGPNQVPGGPNQALGHKTGFQGCRSIKNTILDGSLEQVRFWGFEGDARAARTKVMDIIIIILYI